MKTVVVIPARLNSSRLPNKVILDLAGKPLIQRVYEQVQKANFVDEIYIATDSLKVDEVVKSFGGKVILTSEKHQSGTDRISEAVENITADLIVNVQGDEPLISPKLIDDLIQEFRKKEIYFASAMRKIDDLKNLHNPNVVKVIVDNFQNAIYFSRSPIPFDRDEDLKNSYFQHIGIYAYKKDFLQKFTNLPQSNLEKIEKLEQLRAIENGFKIAMIETEYQSIGVDTLEDLKEIRKKWLD